MYKQSDAALAAWRATERTLDGKVTIVDNSGNETDYGTSDITSIAYDSGAWTGDTFSIGSTYENNITVTFAHLVEGLKQGYKVTAKIGIKLPDGTYEYCPLGVFIISDEITMDRNNDATTIKAYDQFCVMQGAYTSKLTYPAKITDVIAEIANMSGVELNTDDIAELPTQTDLASAISGQTYCTAIGWIAQFYGGFALFGRDGKLTIRTVTDASYILDASQYEQSGLTKNEATYKIGGMSVSVTTTTTDSTGESSETTSTLVAGETSGSQIELTNNVMTQARLDSIWSTIKDITFYPYSLTWFGNPAIEAGDWLTLKDTAGNSFNVPNNSYTMTFDGGLTATSKADQTSTSSSSYSYSGTLSQTVKQLAGRIGATGNYIFGTDTTVEPTTAKIGDQWYKKNGNKLELWQYVRQSDGTGKWEPMVSDLTGEEIKANVDKAMAEADTAKQNANTAVETGNQALTKAQVGIDTANTAADNASTAMSNSSTAINNAKSAMTDAATAISTANNSSDIANAVQQQVTTLKDGSTMTIADLENGLALKLVKSDLNGYATQSWASSQITATANDLQSQVASVKSTADKATTDITTLNQRADGWDSTISSLSTNKADQTWTTNQIKASADSLNVNISKVQTQVNNSAVGTNLLTGTSSAYTTVTNATGYNGNLPTYTFDFNTDVDTQYTARVYLKPSSHPMCIQIKYADSSGNWNFYTGNIVQAGDGGYSTLTVSIPHDAHGAQTTIIFLPPVSDNTQVQWKEYKLEKGSVATDWCPNPADNATVTSVTNLSITLDGIKQTVAKKVDNDTFASYQTQTATLIGSKVASNDFNSYKTQTDNAISQRVTSSAFSSYQTQTDSAIQQRVTSATYNAEITTLSNQINSKVSQMDWANSAVGANLLTGTHSDWQSRDIVDAGDWGTGDNFNLTNNDLDANTDYTFSSEIKSDNGSYLWHTEVSAVDSDGNYVMLSKSNYVSNGKSIITFNTGNYVKFQFRPHVASNDNNITTVYWRYEKLEKGSYATPWCPASSEIANYSQIQQLSNNINLRVVKNDVINQINLSTEGILIAGEKVHITGQTTIDNAVIKSAMIDSISADKITAGTLNAANVSVINLNANNISSGTLSGDYISGGTITGVSFHQSSSNMNTWIDNNGIHNYDDSGHSTWIKDGKLTTNYLTVAGSTKDAILSYDGDTFVVQASGTLIGDSTAASLSLDSANNDVFIYTSNSQIFLSNSKFSSFVGGTTSGNGLEISPTDFHLWSNGKGITYSASELTMNSDGPITITPASNKNATVWGSFTVTGSKNAIVETSAGWAKINAYETAEYYFGDIAKVNTGSGSKVKVEMDSLFLETVNTNVDYHVFVSSYGAGYAWISEQTSTYFVIESSTPNLEVSYEIKAKRKGYENTRLEIDEDFGKEAA